jgi:7,8-dihydropterin-6-yl-methyl-4-(beta-D-ribofuranosyl)aminobenzene 5'-phosphate synthase
VKSGTKVYLPNDYKPALEDQFVKIKFIVNDKFQKIDEGVWLTEIFIDNNRGIREQALILEKGQNIIMLTGCAHPGIADMCESVKNHFPGKKLELVTGGFHLMRSTNLQVTQISDKIKKLGFEKVAPSHCTGENSIAIFRKEWGDNFIPLNLGDTYYF